VSRSPPERLGSYTRRYIGTAQHFGWLERILQVTLVLNVLDAIFTLWWVLTSQAIEANPLMATAIAAHPVVFVCVKLALVGMGSWLLWRHRKRPLAVISIFVAFLVYYGILLLHLRAAELGVLRQWMLG
jgi:formate hydrogenlyase subunit 3/multisubunit Na+/H+ antiporter MnhD subunit